ncbi:MAG: sugar ABC transporter permease YjfF [Anaerolinea sp.]|nr:sugar ABC transporter permease YjfF [Anaerolinea sp.]MCC6975343.1 sugar ABC transporter permease YjfF [Anaerolineae bacterium]CAG1006432.1 Inner membrane ABC transporter permease protein YjfF [Anaerolineae bacterium]
MRSRYIPLLMTFVVFVALYLIAYSRFSSFGSMRVVGNLLRDNAYWGIAAIGMTFVIISGGIDLSVGSVIAFTGVFCALMIGRNGWDPLATFAVILTIGTLFGATMGFFIHYFKIPAFIVTLSGLFLARGMAYVLSTDSIRIDHPFYKQISDLVYVFPDRGRFTFAAGMFLLILIVGIFLAHFTRFGRNVYALGGNSDAALLLGVPVGRTTILVYALSSFLTVLAGIVLSLSKQSGDSTIAVGLELDVIAAVVIGGTLLTGGVGYVIGTFIAVMTLGTIQTYLTLDGSLTPWWIKIVIGILLFSFVALQKLLSSRKRVQSAKEQLATAPLPS